MPAFDRPNGAIYFQTRSASRNPLESAKLDAEFNRIAEWLNSQVNFVQNSSEWAVNPSLPTYISSTQFSLDGNITDVFSAFRKVRVKIGASTLVYSVVIASAYDGGTGKTTVTLQDAVLQPSITELCYGIIGATPAQSSFPANLLNYAVKALSTTPYTVTKFDVVVICDATAGSQALALPLVATAGLGKLYIFRKIDSTVNTVTLTPAGAEKIDGRDNLVLTQPYDTVFLFANSSGWELLQDRVNKLPANLLPGAFGKLKVVNNTGSPQNKINITADYVMVQDAAGLIIPLYAISHTIDFTVSGQADGNCLDNSTLTNSTWYYIWEIAKADGTKAALGSTSPTTPTLPTGYTYKKLLSAVYYANGAFRNIVQSNRQIACLDNALDMTGAINTASWISKDITAFVPPIATAVEMMPVCIVSGAGLSIAVALDNVGTKAKRVFSSYGLDVTVAFEGFYITLTPTRYPLNPSTPQTIYVKGRDTNDRGHLYCCGYEIAI